MATQIFRKTAYGLSEPLINVGQEPIISKRDPLATDRAQLGTEWVNTLTNNAFFITSIEDNIATWIPISGGISSTTFDTDSGTAVTAAGVIDIAGGTGITTSGAGSTVTINSTVTQGVSVFHTDSVDADVAGDAITIAGGNNITTSGSGSTVTVRVSGTTDFAVQVGNVFGSLNSLALGTSGQVLTSNGAGMDPSFQTFSGSGVTQLDGNTGIALPIAGVINLHASTGDGTARITGNSSSTLVLGFSDQAGNHNIGLGGNVLGGLTSGTNNSVFGAESGEDISSGSFNSVLGSDCLVTTTGSYNTILGYESGSNYTTSESSNVLINNTGTVSESHILRIGAATGTGNQQLQAAYICGINGVDLSTAEVVTMASNQLGSTTLTPGSGISITPGSGIVTIAATGGSVLASLLDATTNFLTSGGGDYYTPPFSSTPSATLGVGTQLLMPRAGTLSHLYVNIDSNASTTDTTLTATVNGSPTALVATITALTTGTFFDTTHTVSISAGDLLTFNGEGSTTGEITGGFSVVFN